jgi:hypothetical protein
MEIDRRNRNNKDGRNVIGYGWLASAIQILLRVGIHYKRARKFYRKFWKHVGIKDAEKRNHIPQTTYNLSSINYEKSVVTARFFSMRTQLSYSIYNRQVTASGRASLNLAVILILKFVGCAV